MVILAIASTGKLKALHKGKIARGDHGHGNTLLQGLLYDPGGTQILTPQAKPEAIVLPKGYRTRPARWRIPGVPACFAPEMRSPESSH